MSYSFLKIEDNLKHNINDVYKLMDFDRLILDFSITSIRELQTDLKRSFKVENPSLLAANTLQMIENIRENDSLRPRYKAMFNQSVVLLVSLFASAIADLFREGINTLAKSGDSRELMKEELKISVSDIVEFGSELPNRIGHIIADKKDISFQDMKSIGRAFKDYFSISMEKDENVNNIIFSQAARHVIVHDSSRIDERLKNQVKGALPRDVKEDISSEKHIQFTTDEIKVIGESMIRYFSQLRLKLESQLNES